MSLTVTPDLLDAARQNSLDDDAFVECVANSLPYAYSLVARLAEALPEARSAGLDFADNLVAPPDAETQGQLLRAMASTSIRAALERHFGVVMAFQNCHRVAVFAPVAVTGGQYRTFVSARAQVLNQQPELVNC